MLKPRNRTFVARTHSMPSLMQDSHDGIFSSPDRVSTRVPSTGIWFQGLTSDMPGCCISVSSTQLAPPSRSQLTSAGLAIGRFKMSVKQEFGKKYSHLPSVHYSCPSAQSWVHRQASTSSPQLIISCKPAFMPRLWPHIYAYRWLERDISQDPDQL